MSTPNDSKTQAKPAAQSAGNEQPTAVGRSQLGEKVAGSVTSRVPRGVGEPAADAVGDDAGVKATQEAVRKQVDAEVEQGFRGQQADPTPNENYTVAGVTKGLPTPETTVFTPRGQ